MEQQANQFNRANQALSSNLALILQAPSAIVPYQELSQDVRVNQGIGGQAGGYDGGFNSGGSSGGYNGGYNEGYNGRRSWNSDYRHDKVDRMWTWMSAEMAERKSIKKEKEGAARREEELRMKNEAEEKKCKKEKDKEGFKTSIGCMVGSQMKWVCEEVLGKQVEIREPFVISTTEDGRRRTSNHSKKDLEDDASKRKDEEIQKLN
ncbi:hypothetical protein CBR_g51642 [Chara braunii]|uniref:Uncharacterized protein n=1 Tax=Chara braunii TaxID=69332 RepID=A0A388M8S6_CHABU|nr:hypothetical protein CBR_g51642 [Chara braunii]|eukprot:GBG90984.1 hypothetical protein CBR_g51642 [Chara braunii]